MSSASRLVRAIALGLLLGASPMSEAQVSLTDDVGRTIHLAKPAARVVALEPFLTELVFSVGAGARLVGISSESRYPFETFRITKVRNASAFIGQASSLKPDLVLAWADSIEPEQVERITAAGMTVFVADAPRLADVPRLLRTIGALTGHDGNVPAVDFEHGLERLRQSNIRKPKVAVMVEVRYKPLTTVSARHFLSDALEICRADNVFATQVTPMPEVFLEQVMRRAPRVIVGFGSASSAEEFKGNWSLRRELEAVRAGRLVFLQSDVIRQPTTRSLEEVAQLCEKLDSVRP
jgi:iron complex transport system substrate-binding protein